LTSRSLVTVRVPGGSFDLVVPYLDAEAMDWTEYLAPLAELVADQPGEWSAKPIPDDMDDKEAREIR
jgi:hypothetical protein